MHTGKNNSAPLKTISDNILAMKTTKGIPAEMFWVTGLESKAKGCHWSSAIVFCEVNKYCCYFSY